MKNNLPDWLNRYRGILLDVDGTLIDSNRHHAETWQQTLEEAGYPVTVAQVYRLIGKGSDKLLPELTGIGKDSEVGQALLERQGNLFNQRIPQMQAFSGVREAIEQWRKADMPLDIASSGAPDDIEKLLRQGGLADVLQAPGETESPDVSKPDPDAIILAAQRLGLDPKDCLMIGDTPYDLLAAQKAGCDCLIFRSNPMWTEADFDGALRQFDDWTTLNLSA